jgi:hypothetical protein
MLIVTVNAPEARGQIDTPRDNILDVLRAPPEKVCGDKDI